MRDNEECWVLRGRQGRWFWNAKYDRYTVGQPATVAFDYEYVYRNEKNIIGWIHTHPHWPASPSSTDNATMKAWVCALGRPLLCCILGTDGLRAHWYLDDESEAVEVDVLRIGQKVYGLRPGVRNGTEVCA